MPLENDPTDAANPVLNPYAPPVVVADDARPPKRTRIGRYGWVLAYGGLAVVDVASRVAGLAGIVSDESAVWAPTIAALAGTGVGLAWLRATWERLPPRLQLVDGEPMRGIIARHFIPVYGVFWMFKVQAGLCAALQTKLGEKKILEGAPRGLAMAACGVTIGAYAMRALPLELCLVYAAVKASLWVAYMRAIERTFALAFRRKRA
jgi:hypothetical protein